MKKKKPKSKPCPIAQSPQCRVCGLASEAEGQFCHSCLVIHQDLVDLIFKRSAMIRYAPLHYCDAVSLYELWLRENRRQRVLNGATVIDAWFGRNRHNKAEEKRFWELYILFTEFLNSILISQAEERLEEMFKVLERR